MIVILPSLIATESLASSASLTQLILIVPPVIFKSSLLVIPLSVDDIFNVPVPLSTTSSLEKITASVLVSPSETNVPVTDNEFVPVVVTNTLSALFTYIAGVLVLVE